MYHYMECGLPRVWLVNGFHKIDTPYGEGFQIDHVEALHRSIGRDLVNFRPHLTGAEFRFLRTELDLSQKELAEIFGYEARSVALWEKNGKIPRWADRFIRAIYREFVDGNANLRELIGRDVAPDGDKADRKEYEEQFGSWHSRLAA